MIGAAATLLMGSQAVALLIAVTAAPALFAAAPFCMVTAGILLLATVKD